MKLARKIEILNRVKTLLENDVFCHGICDVFMFLVKNEECEIREVMKVRQLMETHKPTPDNQYKEFTENAYWVGNLLNPTHPLMGFWWKQMGTNPETRKIRIDYLTRLIENIK